VADDCNCQVLSELIPSSPVNSVNNVIDPHCDCNVELELSVPAEPVSVSRTDDPQDAETDLIVQGLSQLPIQMRTSDSLLDDLRNNSSSHGGSVTSSESSTTSFPTTPIFVLKRRSSIDASIFTTKPSNPPIPPPPPHPPSNLNSEVLSVKTLANMFDFKVSPIPIRPCSARLEDNHIYQRMAKQLDNDNVGPNLSNLSQSQM